MGRTSIGATWAASNEASGIFPSKSCAQSRGRSDATSGVSHADCLCPTATDANRGRISHATSGNASARFSAPHRRTLRYDIGSLDWRAIGNRIFEKGRLACGLFFARSPTPITQDRKYSVKPNPCENHQSITNPPRLLQSTLDEGSEMNEFLNGLAESIVSPETQRELTSTAPNR
jgi:hypothetical protein